MSDPGGIHHRCQRIDGVLEVCETEVTPRLIKFAEMIELGDYGNADTMAANITRIVAVHLAEQQMREGRR